MIRAMADVAAIHGYRRHKGLSFEATITARLLILCALTAMLSMGASYGEAERSVPSEASSSEFDNLNEVVSTAFGEGYKILWGESNLMQQDVGKVQLILDAHSGSGFKSRESYYHGFISASIKLPANYSAGVVTAFYTSNAEVFPNNHDELDFEFLGIVPGRTPYTLQTNIYGNGSVSTGREERLHLWFDPTADFHDYSVLWNEHHIVFFVDDIPIRQMVHSEELGGQYPSKPMSVYSTIWDGSQWATEGGRFPVEYSKGPFIASFNNFKLYGCAASASEVSERCFSGDGLTQMAKLSAHEELFPQQKVDLEWARNNYMYYSYCDDVKRYPEPPSDCATTIKPVRPKTHKRRNKMARHHRHGTSADQQAQKQDSGAKKAGTVLDRPLPSDASEASVQSNIAAAALDQRSKQLSEVNIRRRLGRKFSLKNSSLPSKMKFAGLPPSLRVLQ